MNFKICPGWIFPKFWTFQPNINLCIVYAKLTAQIIMQINDSKEQKSRWRHASYYLVLFLHCCIEPYKWRNYELLSCPFFHIDLELFFTLPLFVLFSLYHTLLGLSISYLTKCVWCRSYDSILALSRQLFNPLPILLMYCMNNLGFKG